MGKTVRKEKVTYHDDEGNYIEETRDIDKNGNIVFTVRSTYESIEHKKQISEYVTSWAQEHFGNYLVLYIVITI